MTLLSMVTAPDMTMKASGVRGLVKLQIESDFPTHVPCQDHPVGMCTSGVL